MSGVPPPGDADGLRPDAASPAAPAPVRSARRTALTEPSANIHGCALLLNGIGILVVGPARSGKSALCLSTLRRGAASGLDARLVADDRVIVDQDVDGTRLSGPERLVGLIEISGVGILREASTAPFARLDLVVELTASEAIERLPGHETTTAYGAAVRLIRLPMRQSAFGADILVSLACGTLLDEP